MLDRLASGAAPAIAFMMLVGGLALYDVIGPPLIDAAHGAFDRVDIGRPNTNPGTREPTDIPSGDGLAEGIDWSLIDPAQGLLRWSCDEEIPVQLVGPAPDGADEAVESVVTELAGISGLHLFVQAAEPEWSDDEWREGEILIRYVNPDERQAPGIDFNDDTAIGRGGPVSSGHTIRAGYLAIRIDKPFFANTDPTTEYGKAVLLHELGHSIGAGHSHGSQGVMTESGADTELSAGDLHVFQLLGCPE